MPQKSEEYVQLTISVSLGEGWSSYTCSVPKRASIEALVPKLPIELLINDAVIDDIEKRRKEDLNDASD